uniref:Nucleus accumbens associated 1, BEN and BTB (POZ) domain containing [Myotis brandtii] n=1 Tax=Lepeophtheirus salmonis TaxID=72036 RepID=A0A0K2UVC7_LEPSM
MSSTHNLKFSSTFLKNFGNAVSDLLNHEKLTDLRFITVNEQKGTTKSFNAHQFLFTPKSAFLRTLCNEARGKQLISDPVIITLPGISPHSMQAVIDYFYTGITDFELRDDLEDMCLLLGIDNVDLDNNETDIKSNGARKMVGMNSENENNQKTSIFSVFTPDCDDEYSSEEEENGSTEVINRSSICTNVTNASTPNVEKRSLKKRIVVGPSTAQRKNKKSNKKNGYLSNRNYLKGCTKCSSIFVAENSYLEHIKKCTRKGVDDNENSITIANGTSKKSKSKIKISSLIREPKRSFVVLNRLKIDGQQSSPTKKTSPSKKGRLVKCKFCDLTFDKLYNLRNHILNHFKDKLYPYLPASKPYACPDCYIEMRDRITLLRHYSYSHRHVFKLCSEDDVRGVVME